MSGKEYNTPNGTIFQLDTFKGKRVLVGDYLDCSFMNTKMVLDSLGLEVIRETAEPRCLVSSCKR